MLIIYPLLFAVTNNFITFKYGDVFLCLFLSAQGNQSFMFEIQRVIIVKKCFQKYFLQSWQLKDDRFWQTVFISIFPITGRLSFEFSFENHWRRVLSAENKQPCIFVCLVVSLFLSLRCQKFPKFH